MFQKIHNLTEREYWALIGINKKDFRELTVVFSECEQKIKNQAYEDFVEKYYRKPTAVGSPKFKIPFKESYKTKNNLDPQLTPEQKAYNKFVSKTRVNVENAIGGIKHYNILVQTFRNKSDLLETKQFFSPLVSGILQKTFPLVKQ